MIQIASNIGDIVFDPFMGVGSVGVAAIGLGRRYFGVEIDSEYFRAAKLRVGKELEGTDNTPLGYTDNLDLDRDMQ